MYSIAYFLDAIHPNIPVSNCSGRTGNYYKISISYIDDAALQFLSSDLLLVEFHKYTIANAVISLTTLPALFFTINIE